MFSTVVLAASCNKQEAAPPPPPAQPPPVARAEAAAATTGERVPDGGPPAPVLAKPPGAAGEWIESDAYAFRLEGLRACAKNDRKHFGAAVSIKAKIDELAVSPRDVSIESAGIIFQGELPQAASATGCGASLPLRQLRKDQAATGLVVFTVPEDFVPAPGSAKLSYRPTRWGGAGRVQVSLPDCLASCPAAVADGGKGKGPGKARLAKLKSP
jgi:hypothetical protein